MYAAASFKILLLASKPIVIYKLLLSIFITLYYIVYMIRLLVGVVLTSSINPNSSLQVLFVAMKPNKKRSAISRLYIPLLMLRNMGIALILVFLSSTPELQIGMSFGVCVLFTIYSMIWCPYSLLTRLIVHLF